MQSFGLSIYRAKVPLRLSVYHDLKESLGSLISFQL